MAAIVTVCLAGSLLAAGAGTAGATTVRVRWGDTLTSLANRFGVTVRAFAAANHLQDPNRVLNGSVLQVPTPPDPDRQAGYDADSDDTASAPANASTTTVVVVRTGDTLTDIARRAGTSVQAIALANHLTNPNRVLVGTRLVVPHAATSTGAPSTTPPTSIVPPALQAHPVRLALRPVFQHWAATFGLAPSLLEAMCWWESGWQATVISSTGAIGVCQLEPSTVRLLQSRLRDPALDPRVASDNIEMAAADLHDLLVVAGGNDQWALAAYYQGLASVRRYGMLPATRYYVRGILAYVPAFS